MLQVFRRFDDPADHFRFLNPGYRAPEVLRSTMALEETGQSLLLVKVQGQPGPCRYAVLESMGDDRGSYLALSHLNLRVSSPETAYQGFFGAILAFGLVLGWFGCLRLFERGRNRFLAMALWFAVFLRALYVMDVYSVEFLCAGLGLALLPAIEKWGRRIRETRSKGGGGVNSKHWLSGTLSWFMAPAMAAMAAAGVIAGFSQIVRSYSSLPMIVSLGFVAVSLVVSNPSRKPILGAVLAALLFGAGFAVAPAWVSSRQEARDAWLDARPECSRRPEFSRSHGVWHNALVGLSYLQPNPIGAVWSDSWAFALANRKRPGLNASFYNGPAEYDEVIRTEFMKVLELHPGFVAKVFLLKALELLRRSLPFWLPGVFALFRGRKRIGAGWMLGAFGPALAIASAPSVIAWPFPIYGLGFFAWCAVFSIVAWARAFEGDANRCSQVG